MEQIKDYRKWISFNNQLAKPENLYHLFKALESENSYGKVSLRKAFEENGTVITIEQEGYNSKLELSDDTEIESFKSYLRKFYIADRDFESWYKEKTSGSFFSNGSENSALLSETVIKPDINNFTPHSKEVYYYYLRLFFSCVFYLVGIILLTLAYFDSVTRGAIATIISIGVIFMVFLLRKMLHGIFLGVIKGNSIKVSEKQFPEIYNIVKETSDQLGFNDTPEIYIARGDFNSFVTRFAKKRYLLLLSELIETAKSNDKEVLKFVVGHELCHLKRKHLEIEKWLYPSRLIPFLTLAHSRACEYTCDRMGYYFSKEGAMAGIVILAAGKEIYTQVNLENYIEDSQSQASFWVWLSEKFLSHPHLSKRLIAINDYDKFN